MPYLTLGDRLLRKAWRLTPKRLLSRVIGWGARRRLPARLQIRLLRSYARAYQLNCDETESPIECYRSLQEFFTRRLRQGTRLIPSDPGLVVAPSDGTVCDAGRATEGKLLEAKGSAFTLQELLADDALAERLRGGPYVVIYLSPRDYHRVHFPVAGKVVSWTHVPGSLFPVGDKSVKREPGLFARNERLITVIDGPSGRCAVVMVAAVGVGHITATYDSDIATHARSFSTGKAQSKVLPSPRAVERGDELGIFNLGSTTITLFEPGRVELADLAPGEQMKMGTPVGRIIAG